METLAGLFVGRPLSILVVALFFLGLHVVVRTSGIGSGRHRHALLVVAAAWAIYAAWEWLVIVRTPEANIRVDLLVIWPALAILSIWFVIRALR